MSTNDFRNALRDELVRAAKNKTLKAKRRARRAVALILTGLMAILATVLYSVLAPSPSAASVLKVEQVGTETILTVFNTDAPSDVFLKELKQSGLNARIEEIPASPAVAGKMIDIYQSSPVNKEHVSTMTWKMTINEKSPVVVRGGRMAANDEPYAYSASALNKNEPLHCSNVIGMSAIEAEQLISPLNFSVDWMLTAPTRPGLTTPIKDPDAIVSEVLRTGNRKFLVMMSYEQSSKRTSEDSC